MYQRLQLIYRTVELTVHAQRLNDRSRGDCWEVQIDLRSKIERAEDVGAELIMGAEIIQTARLRGFEKVRGTSLTRPHLGLTEFTQSRLYRSMLCHNTSGCKPSGMLDT